VATPWSARRRTSPSARCCARSTVHWLRPEQTRYGGAAEHLPRLWVAVRAAVRDVLDEVSLAEVVGGDLPAHVRRLTEGPDAWLPR
jgi:DNA-binding IscR family transcriptional regulator